MNDEAKRKFCWMLGQHQRVQRDIDQLKEQQRGLEYHLAMTFQKHEQEAFELQERFLDDMQMNGRA